MGRTGPVSGLVAARSLGDAGFGEQTRSAGWSLRGFVVCAVADQSTTDWRRSGPPDGADAFTGERWDGVGWRSASWLRRTPVVSPSFLTLLVRPATEVSPP